MQYSLTRTSGFHFLKLLNPYNSMCSKLYFEPVLVTLDFDVTSLSTIFVPFSTAKASLHNEISVLFNSVTTYIRNSFLFCFFTQWITRGNWYSRICDQLSWQFSYRHQLVDKILQIPYLWLTLLLLVHYYPATLVIIFHTNILKNVVFR